ncbi:MAG: PorT family protein [Balneolales bacterium]|nr:PorT family protein [Balneolales bacterium]
MNITKRFGLLLLGVLFFQTAYSQENFVAGYVITNSADTLNGYVDYRNWRHNPNRIAFKMSREDRPATYRPTDILEFGLEGEIYVSGIVDIETSPSATSKLHDYPELNIRVDTTFLQVLIRGERSLYYHKKSADVENFYIDGDDGGYDLLVYKRYMSRSDGARSISENKGYLSQLRQYLSGCETIVPKLQNVSYNQRNLRELFQKYHACTSSEVTYQKQRERIRAEFGVLAGVSATTIHFKSNLFFVYLASVDYDPSINVAGGIFLDLILPRTRERWSINTELFYSSYSITGRSEIIEREEIYLKTRAEIDYTYLKINNLIRYRHPVGRMTVFINTGVSNGVAIRERDVVVRDSRNFSMYNSIERKGWPYTRKYEQGFIIGTGLQHNQFSVELRYERGNGMTSKDYLTHVSSRTNRYFFLLGYRF